MANEKLDAVVLALFKKVKAKKEEISKTERPSWKSNCSLGYNPDVVTDRTNLQTCSDLEKLLDLYIFIDEKETKRTWAAGMLGIPTTGKYMGSTFEAWKVDIQSRVNQINVSVKKKELEALEARLNSLITVDQRRELELKAIQDEMEKGGFNA